tara:strand:+ start:2322 stop:2783 length:462 start_codon:yes stop_codon:yes gene_type:complete
MIDIFFDKVSISNKKEIELLAKNTLDFGIRELKIKKDFYISVLLTDNQKIKEMNLRYRKINKPTNVLSFNQNEKRIMEDKSFFIILGDIVVSIEKIMSESLEQGKTFKQHFTHMLLHGLLHLTGHSHEEKEKALIMEKKEILMLSKLSIPSPY